MKNTIFLIASFFTLNALAGVNTVLYENYTEHCNITISHDAVKGSTGTIIIRPRTADYNYCRLPKEQLSNHLNNALKTLSNKKNLTEITSLFLGRLKSYHWMRDHLIRESVNNEKWNKELGKAINESNIKYVNALLKNKYVLETFSRPLNKHSYKITDISCKKVLINKDKLPYDAMCWLSIKRSRL